MQSNRLARLIGIAGVGLLGCLNSLNSLKAQTQTNTIPRIGETLEEIPKEKPLSIGLIEVDAYSFSYFLEKRMDLYISDYSSDYFTYTHGPDEIAERIFNNVVKKSLRDYAKNLPRVIELKKELKEWFNDRFDIGIGLNYSENQLRDEIYYSPLYPERKDINYDLDLGISLNPYIGARILDGITVRGYLDKLRLGIDDKITQGINISAGMEIPYKHMDNLEEWRLYAMAYKQLGKSSIAGLRFEGARIETEQRFIPLKKDNYYAITGFFSLRF